MGKVVAELNDTSSASSEPDLSTGVPGATVCTGSGANGLSAAPHSFCHASNWAEETANTILPNPIHACAAEHNGQCSPEV